MTIYSSIKITPQQAQDILSDLYNIKGQASAVHGELDFNFKVTADGDDKYILKISRPDADEPELDFQQQILIKLTQDKNVVSPDVIKDKHGNLISEFTDTEGKNRKVRLLSWIPGRLWYTVNPQLDKLRLDLGKQAGLITKALQDFTHPKAERKLVWDVGQAAWTKEFQHLFNGEQKELVDFFYTRFETVQPSYNKLRKSIVHNDVNNHNILVSDKLINPSVKAIIDYGDAIHTQIINDLAIACSYAIMGFNDPLEAALPLVQGYHASFVLNENELEHLYIAIAMRLVISVTKSALNKIAEPDNKYLLISEKPAWESLKKWRAINEEFATYSFRNTCGYSAHPNESRFKAWSDANEFSLAELFPGIEKNEVTPLDLSVASKWVGNEREFNDLDLFEFKLNKLQNEHPEKIIAGGYLEARALYIAPEYDSVGNRGRQSRTVHLGIDYWLPANTPVHALLDGEVIAATDNAGDKQYGGLIILKHTVKHQQGDDFLFYSLYGHLTINSATQHQVGDLIKKGQCFAQLGSYPENGNWASHLHFQLMLSMLDYQDDFAGVAFHSQTGVWRSLCPDPNFLFKSEGLQLQNEKSNQELINYRKQHLGKGLSLQYKVPIKMVRGTGQYLLDQYGTKYLDTVNNVAHVGHEHPDVVKAGQEQMALLNTNSRYLHDNINELAQELLATLPDELSVVHFVNSGSEANELALRMAKTVTGEKDIIASEVGYHGNTNATVDISSYKFDGKGGSGAPEHTHIFPLPDGFRGKYRGDDSGNKYATEVQGCIEHVQKKGRGIAGMIVEPIISCGGQVVLPDGFLKQACQYVRKAGGLCISDEVQVGCGRMGKVFWGFQLHDVVPDIVTIGKPLGNGHPVAAVVCTQEVADKFANGMEYFNTFGGNPVSCAIGAEVLKVVKREKLQENALKVGHFLKQELKKLSQKYPVIGDVRGEGLFLGIELVDKDLNPREPQTTYLANRMKDHGILMSTDGPGHNVLKIKPPLLFSVDDANDLLFYLDKIMGEDFMQAM